MARNRQRINRNTTFLLHVTNVSVIKQILISQHEYCHVWLLDRVRIGWLDLLIPYTHHMKLHAITVLRLISVLYSSLLQTLVSSVYWSLYYPFLEMDFNTGTIIVSLSYILQISRYYSTREVFSTKPDFQLHWTALNNSDASIQFLCSQAHVLLSWRLETQLTHCHLFSIIQLPYQEAPSIIFVIQHQGGPSRKHLFLTITLLLQWCVSLTVA
jgi:hypothetical protein